jgi:hypothetical protein
VDEAYDDDQGDARSHKRVRNGGVSDRQGTHFPHPLSVDSTLMTLSISTSPFALLLRTWGYTSDLRLWTWSFLLDEGNLIKLAYFAGFYQREISERTGVPLAT